MIRVVAPQVGSSAPSSLGSMSTPTSPQAQFVTCHLSQKSRTRCGPSSTSPLQTLDELDASSMRVPGKQMKMSWMILSRVGVEYLNAHCGRWTVCQNHRKEFLDAWQVASRCCYPEHEALTAGKPADQASTAHVVHLVSMIMSIKILQAEGKVVPISGKLCRVCKDHYDTKYSSKSSSSEKIVIVVPKSQMPMTSALSLPSPFFHQPQHCKDLRQPIITQDGVGGATEPCAPSSSPTATTSPDLDMIRSLNLLPRRDLQPPTPPTQVITNTVSTTTSAKNTAGSGGGYSTRPRKSSGRNLRSNPDRSKEPPLQIAARPDSPSDTESIGSITIKIETTAEESDLEFLEEPRNSGVRAEAEVHEGYEEEDDEDDEEDILSHDSDDDPTWAPSHSDKGGLTNGTTTSVGTGRTKELSKRPNKRVRVTDLAKHSTKDSSSPRKRGRPSKQKQEGFPKKSLRTVNNNNNNNNNNGSISKRRRSKVKASPPGTLFVQVGQGKGSLTKTIGEEASSSDDDLDNVDLSEEANRIEGAPGGSDFHYLCKICQISFFRHNAFKHHMNKSREEHKLIRKRQKMRRERERELEPELRCVACCIAFKDQKSYQIHQSKEHRIGKRGVEEGAEEDDDDDDDEDLAPRYHCQKCDVYLRSESSFKSHNSKLHLERREKTYYCRECDETFSCLIKHSVHIAVHRTWSSQDMGMQCRICGKVYSRNQTLHFHKHLATHDDSALDMKCGCSNCTAVGEPGNQEDPLTLGGPSKSSLRGRSGKSNGGVSKLHVRFQDPLPSKSSKRNSKGLLESMQLTFRGGGPLSKETRKAETPESLHSGPENDDEEALMLFECGLCCSKYSTVEKLEAHVLEKHSEGKAKDSSHQKANTDIKPKSSDADAVAAEISSEVIDEVADEFAGEVAAFEEAEERTRKRLKEHQEGVKIFSSLGNSSDRDWQCCPSRNWAAEFGYGGTSSSSVSSGLGGRAEPGGGSQSGTKINMAKEMQRDLEGHDLLSKMRMIFRKDNEDHDPSSSDEGEAGAPSRKAAKKMGLRHRLVQSSGEKDLADDRKALKVKSAKKRPSFAASSRSQAKANAAAIDDVDEDVIFRSRGLGGVVKASPDKAPRTLSSSSLKTRKRIEALMRRAREFMRERRRERNRAKKAAAAAAAVIAPVDEVAATADGAVEEAAAMETSTVQTDHDLLVSRQHQAPLDQGKCVQKNQGQVILASSPPASPSWQAETSTKPSESNRKEVPGHSDSYVEIASQAKPSEVDYEREFVRKRKRRSVGDVVESTATRKITRSCLQQQLQQQHQLQQQEQERLLLLSSSSRELGATSPPSSSNEDDEDMEGSDFEDEDDDDDDDEDLDPDCDGLLIPLENGWVCEKRPLTEGEDDEDGTQGWREWSSSSSFSPRSADQGYATHFWSPDGQRHNSLSSIRTYGIKNKLWLNMEVFERAYRNNPVAGDYINSDIDDQ